MPWRALGVRRAPNVEIAEESNDPEWMLLRLPMKGGHREAAVVPVLRRPGGLMLAVSAKFFKDSELEEKAIPGVVEDLGPINRIQVEGVPDDLDAEGEEVDLVLVDWPQAFFKHLLGGGANPTWPLGAMFPSSASAVYKNLNYEQLAMVARTWVQNGQGPHTDGYQTAWENFCCDGGPSGTEAGHPGSDFGPDPEHSSLGEPPARRAGRVESEGGPTSGRGWTGLGQALGFEASDSSGRHCPSHKGAEAETPSSSGRRHRRRLRRRGRRGGCHRHAVGPAPQNSLGGAAWEQEGKGPGPSDRPSSQPWGGGLGGGRERPSSSSERRQRNHAARAFAASHGNGVCGKPWKWIHKRM